MLTDIKQFAVLGWIEHTERDLLVLNEVQIGAGLAAAEIAANMGHIDVANAILEMALQP